MFQVKILAIDDGDPPKTATATLTVTVDDINDNAPRFLKDYRPVLPEHSAPRKVVEVLATDDDDRLAFFFLLVIQRVHYQIRPSELKDLFSSSSIYNIYISKKFHIFHINEFKDRHKATLTFKVPTAKL